MYQSEVFEKFKSNAQRTRVLTEDWMSKVMFCPNCLNNKLSTFPNNHPTSDFFCQRCIETYQLKSQRTKFGRKINDGAYSTMMKSIIQNTRPHFFLLQYNEEYKVKDLFLIPSFFFTETIIEKRRPLRENAKRKGWVGCNIIIEKIPPEGKIWVLKENHLIKREEVAYRFRKMLFLKNSSLPERGWIVDVLRIIHQITGKEFTLKDVYSYETELSKDHPNNYHIKDKLRQQLQILRDKKIIRFKGTGHYEKL